MARAGGPHSPISTSMVSAPFAIDLVGVQKSMRSHVGVASSGKEFASYETTCPKQGSTKSTVIVKRTIARVISSVPLTLHP